MKIKNVKAQLDEILEEEKQYKFLKNQGTNPSNLLERATTSLVEVAEVKGREEDMDSLVTKLITNTAGGGQEGQFGSIHMTAIVGTGGLGKTTLAQLVYNDSRVKDCFPLRIWICVSDPFEEARIAKDIVESVKRSRPETNQLEMLHELVIESVSGKKFLLVFDDVWTENEEKWRNLKNALKHGATGSSVLVTTRNKRVAIMMGATENKMHHLGLLSDEDCWLLLHRIAFKGRNEENFKGYLDIGRKIANKCNGLPLAAKVLGSLLRFKNTVEAWENVLNSEVWQLEEAKLDLFPHLVLSYKDLSPTLKRCFSYCAVFPKGYEIDVGTLIRNWMALGYLSSNGNRESDLELEDIGQQYFDRLAMLSLFQDLEINIIRGDTKCKMHDIVHDFAQFLREGDGLNSSQGKVGMVALKNTSTCQACNPLSVSRIKEYRSLFCGEERVSLHVCDCHIVLRVLSLRRCSLQSIPKEMEKLIHLRDLDLSFNELSAEDLKSIVCKIYNLQSLVLSNCDLKEIPPEIGDLVHLRHLDLSRNSPAKKLPESTCNLHELRTLDISFCGFATELLPQGIHNLINLKGLHNEGTHSFQLPQGLSQLTSLRQLDKFYGGNNYWTKFAYLKKLNRLGNTLSLIIGLRNMEDVVEVLEDAQEAELIKKIHIQRLDITFVVGNDEEKPSCMDVLDALRPHANLREFFLSGFKAAKFPGWIALPHYQLRKITIDDSHYCSSLPPFGLLPCLEELFIHSCDGLEFVGREFLGITPSSLVSSSSTTNIIGFPKLKTLRFDFCSNWKEWEDITADDQEDFVTISVMPCLTLIEVRSCHDLTMLPHRLLRQTLSLEKLDLQHSLQLLRRYDDDEDPFRKLISHIPQVECGIYRS